MKSTATKFKEWLKRQLDSYKSYPAKSCWDKGYKTALEHCMVKLVELDGRLK